MFGSKFRKILQNSFFERELEEPKQHTHTKTRMPYVNNGRSIFFEFFIVNLLSLSTYIYCSLRKFGV